MSVRPTWFSVVIAGADARSSAGRRRCRRIDPSAVGSSDPPIGIGSAFDVNLMCMLPLADTDVWTRERRRRIAAAAAAVAAATAARFGEDGGGSNADVW